MRIIRNALTEGSRVRMDGWMDGWMDGLWCSVFLVFVVVLGFDLTLLILLIVVFLGRYRVAAQRIVYSLGTEQGLFAPPGSNVSEAVLIANQHDCGYAACTVIETDYYLFEALRRLEGKLP